jgi:hypothetical protein
MDVKGYKPARRKTWAFFSIQALCALSAWKHGITWPTAALSGGSFLIYVGGISTEKIFLDFFKKKFGMMDKGVS